MDGDILLYRSDDGDVELNVRTDGNTMWVSAQQMCILFDRDKSVISRHINNVFSEGELDQNSTVADFATVQNEGGRDIERNIRYYNLDVVISVGYRVKSVRGTQFRIWATKILKEYIVKGFAMDDKRLKEERGYFEELLERIRDIRSSEKVFWRKVLDIYATSVDYDPNSEMSQLFFKTVQNKMHWAAHGMTAPEKIFYTADSTKPNMGLQTFKGNRPRVSDITIAKNYCNEEELKVLNQIVSAYLEIAELQAMGRNPMRMKDWTETLDSFLKLTRKDILSGPGRISRETAEAKAKEEYRKYNILISKEPSEVDIDFLRSVEEDVRKLKDNNDNGDDNE